MPVENKENQDDKNKVSAGEQNALSSIDEKTVNDKVLPMLNKITAKLNPKNRWVDDYSDKGNFDSAYIAARKNGEKVFMYKNKRYSTNYNGTPEQQLMETGITDHQLGTTQTARNFGNNGPIYNFANPITTYVDAAILNNKNKYRKQTDSLKKENELSKDEKQEYDALLLSTGLPQKYNTFKINSIYKPINGTEKYYYSLNNDQEFVRKKINSIDEIKRTATLGPKKNGIQDHNLLLGYYTTAYDKDDRGEYIVYRDTWDLNPFDAHRGNNKLLKQIVDWGQNILVGKPLEIYDRIYYKNYDGINKQMFFSDQELKNLDINKGNFDVLHLQKELSNRGYDLLESKKENGDFDGVLGNETKQALGDWQSKNKSKF